MSKTDDKNRRHWILTVILAVCVAVLVDYLVTIEWSFPYCNDPQDGPSSAVFGLPLPYERWNMVSSLQYEFMPHIYAINVLVLAALMVPLVRYVAGRLADRSPRRTRAIAVCIFALGVVGVSWHGLALAAGWWQPTVSIYHPPYDSLAELRPVGVSFGRHYDCTPSSYWFPAHWHSPVAFETAPDNSLERTNPRALAALGEPEANRLKREGRCAS